MRTLALAVVLACAGLWSVPEADAQICGLRSRLGLSRGQSIRLDGFEIRSKGIFGRRTVIRRVADQVQTIVVPSSRLIVNPVLGTTTLGVSGYSYAPAPPVRDDAADELAALTQEIERVGPAIEALKQSAAALTAP